MKIIKRSGTEVTFDIAKIMAAVSKANKEVVHSERLSDEQKMCIRDRPSAEYEFQKGDHIKALGKKECIDKIVKEIH